MRPETKNRKELIKICWKCWNHDKRPIECKSCFVAKEIEKIDRKQIRKFS